MDNYLDLKTYENMINCELHLTVKQMGLSQIDAFSDFCKTIDAKPIIIELAAGEHFQQPMISKIIKCGDKTQLEKEVEILEQQFSENGYEVIRRKIEVAPWDKEKASKFYQEESKGYFEWHGKIEAEKENLIQEIVQVYGGRLSQNLLKGGATKFVTLRDYGGKESIEARIENIKRNLREEGLSFLKEEFEYCIYDSNELLDKGWID